MVGYVSIVMLHLLQKQNFISIYMKYIILMNKQKPNGFVNIAMQRFQVDKKCLNIIKFVMKNQNYQLIHLEELLVKNRIKNRLKLYVNVIKMEK